MRFGRSICPHSVILCNRTATIHYSPLPPNYNKIAPFYQIGYNSAK